LERHERGCACRSCIGRRNRRKGLRKQRIARKVLGVPDARFHGQLANEENWRANWRVEVKSGAQVGPIATRFLAAERQADANKAIGDPRPFMMVAMPDDWGSEGIVLIRLSDLRGILG
jgi:hypothetical protein